MKKKPGRPKAPYKTITIAFRVRVEHADAIRQAVKELQRKLIATPLQKYFYKKVCFLEKKPIFAKQIKTHP